jgi:RIO-like serine/threonine protein kinase
MSASASASLCESRLAASLDHPNVVPVYDAGEADGRLFIAMRYVEDGVDLRTLLREAAPLAPERVVGIAAQLAEALDAAHQRGLVHRDVKPSNVCSTSEATATTPTWPTSGSRTARPPRPRGRAVHGHRRLCRIRASSGVTTRPPAASTR